MTTTIKVFHEVTPITDKILAAVGFFAAGLSLSDLSSAVGIAVGVVTLCMITPRAILNWIELAKAREDARLAALKDGDKPEY